MNTPNKITLLRIGMIPFIMLFFLADFIPWGKFIGGVLFILACSTDFLDGYLARKNNEVTTIGKFLDAIADKLLVTTALILLIATPVATRTVTDPVSKIPVESMVSIFDKLQWVAILFTVIILAREFLVSALRQLAASKGKVLAAEKSGKIKACFQYVTIALYMFYAFFVVEFYTGAEGMVIANTIFATVLIALFGVTVILTVTSGFSYFANNVDVFQDDVAAPVEPVQKEEEITVVVDEQPKKRGRKKAAEKAEEAKETNKTTTKKKAKKTPAKKKNSKKADSGKTRRPPVVENVNKDSQGRSLDFLIPQAMEMFWEKGWASTTMLQKNFGVGYPRASKIVDQMADIGLISQSDGINPRSILVGKEDFAKYEHLFKN